MLNNRRQELLARITSKCTVINTGFKIDGVLSPCHIWQGSHSGNGRGGYYGRVSVNGQTCAVHIVVFTHYYGYIPGNRQVDHLCSQRACCNPLHLDLVTNTKNQRRKHKRRCKHG